MTVDYIISQLINGICQGSIYALMAIGYTVIVGVVGMVTFTYGEIIMVGAFSAFYILDFSGNNILFSILGGFLTSFIVGGFVYKICYEKFLNAPRHVSLVCTIGVSILIKNLVQIICGPNQKPLLNVVENKTFGSGLVTVSVMQLLIIAVVAICALLLSLLFSKTKTGLKLRLVSQDKTASYIMGVNVGQTAMLGNCLGCGLAGVAGVLLAIYYQLIVATMGGNLSMKAFSSSVMGGLTNVGLSAIGGLIIGIVENIGIAVTTASFRDMFAFIFLIIMLVINPNGLGTRKRGRS